ncbi:hypothetical protein EBR03_02085 [bacterium]|nr:hypothetical protein [bacterium]NBW98339.1 hypothetical protein [bacterium]
MEAPLHLSANPLDFLRFPPKKTGGRAQSRGTPRIKTFQPASPKGLTSAPGKPPIGNMLPWTLRAGPNCCLEFPYSGVKDMFNLLLRTT